MSPRCLLDAWPIGQGFRCPVPSPARSVLGSGYASAWRRPARWAWTSGPQLKSIIALVLIAVAAKAAWDLL
jgi:hypothetical protein